jgi:UDP-3-O-[3-hydroxymyristoyl] glucosamine N-acyltransferase
VILQDGVVIGADGFGFAKRNDGSYCKIVQSGKVILEDNVEVQANSTIDRAAIGETRIHNGAKIDNLVQVGHGSKVGENTLLCAQVGLAGSTDVGNNVILTGQVGVAGHCRVGNNVIATAQSGIPSDVEDGKMVSGYPAIDNRLWLKASVVFSKLPEMSKKIREIEQKVEKLLTSR